MHWNHSVRWLLPVKLWGTPCISNPVVSRGLVFVDACTPCCLVCCLHSCASFDVFFLHLVSFVVLVVFGLGSSHLPALLLSLVSFAHGSSELVNQPMSSMPSLQIPSRGWLLTGVKLAEGYPLSCASFDVFFLHLVSFVVLVVFGLPSHLPALLLSSVSFDHGASEHDSTISQ